jgi:hypothetical protein
MIQQILLLRGTNSCYKPELHAERGVFGAAVCSGGRKNISKFSMRCLADQLATVLEKSVFSLAWGRFRNEEQ